MQNLDYNFERFISLNKKEMAFSEVMENIALFVKEEPDREYRVIVGSDSEGYGMVAYATAIVIHRVGSGGRAYIAKNIVKTPRSLRSKIYNEAMLSLGLGQQILPELINAGLLEENFMIHVDVGPNGQTKDMIKEIVGMVKGFGFQVATKPESYAASSVADRFAAPPKHVAA